MAMTITSPVFRHEGAIPARYTCEGDDVSPPLMLGGVPPAAKSLALIVDDPDAPDPAAPKRVWVHWVIYNIPSTSMSIPQNIPTDAHLENGAEQGKNVRGSVGYIGPKPPAGQSHPYHFEVFALNTRLNMGNADRTQVLNAMRNHVLGSGEVVVNYTGK